MEKWEYQTLYPTSKTFCESWEQIKWAYNKLFVILDPSRNRINLQQKFKAKFTDTYKLYQ